jgi:class 3 adenylate cyclase/tetratricopeptide (TPR) repeat protein
MESLAAYISIDRLLAMTRGQDLPRRASGAALFADISGSTPLAEVLVKELGRQRGAEEFTSYLNAAFEALVAAVYRYGGSVISFSGDAITCWLDGDTGLRAVACGLAMQQAMQRFGQLQPSSGTKIPLAVKVAVATGPVRRFRVGDPSIQYIDVLAGKTVDRMATAEKKARRGEVVIAEEVVAALGDQVQVAKVRPGDGNNRFVVVEGLKCMVDESSWPTLTGSQVETIGEMALRLWLLAPVYEQLRHGQERFLAEIRSAVALFLRFRGIEYDDDEAAGQKLDTFIQRVQRSVTRYGGYLLQVTHGDHGSYLYAAFGAPVAYGDNAVRAVAAALELRSLPAELGFIEEVRVGINQGWIWAGAYGAPTRRTYGALGNEVNVAARLMDKAQPGEVVVSQRVVDAAARHYLFDYRGPVAVKGQSEPVPVFVVVSEYLSLPLPPSSLVGREPELAQLDQLQAEVLAGAGQIVRLEGDAGIGKSCLAAELVKRATERKFQVCVGICQSTTQAIAYHPWRQVFRTLLDLKDGPDDYQAIQAAVERTNPAWLIRLPLLGAMLGLSIPDNPTTAALTLGVRQQWLFALVAEMIRTWAHAHPLLLLIEDAHWLDEASRRLLLALGQSVADMPVLLVLVHRPQQDPLLPDLISFPHHHPIALHELALPEITALVVGRLQGSASPLALALIHALAQGNPFFTEELVSALRESGVLGLQADKTWTLSEATFDNLHKANCLVRKDGEWTLAPGAAMSAAGLGIPDSVHSTVLARLDRLPEAHRLTLKVASVIGQTFELNVLAQAHPSPVGETTLDEQMADMEARELIYPETPSRRTYRFKHTITQEVAYGTLLRDQQRDLHRSVGESLERLLPEAVERLAYHYSRSGMRDKALTYLDKAAHKARREYAYETALNYYNQALALEERWEWLRDKADILRKQGDYLQAKHWYERAVVLLRGSGEAVEEVQLFNGLGTIHREQGDFAPAGECYRQALAASRRSGDRPGEADALNNLGVLAAYQSQFEEAITSHRQALEIRRAVGDRAGEGVSLGDLALALRDAGDYTQAWDYLSRALVIQRDIGDRREEANVWNDIGVIYLLVGDLPNAQDCFEKGLTLSREIGDEAGEAYFLGNLGLVACDWGNLEEAERLLTLNLAWANKQEDRRVASYALSYLANVSLLAGRPYQAVGRAKDALSLRQKLGLHELATADLTTLAAAHLKAGDTAQAVDYARQALAILDACQGEGPEYPHRDYFVCYQVLAAAGLDEDARAALRSAHALVMSRAAKIADPALRRSFLERVQVNREIVQEYEKVARLTPSI